MSALDGSIPSEPAAWDASADAAPADTAAPEPMSAYPPLDGGNSRLFREVENNDDLVVANELGYGSATVIGSSFPSNDIDLFRIQLTQVTDLELELIDTSDDPNVLGCLDQAMSLRLLNAAGTVLDSDAPADACPKLDWQIDTPMRQLSPGIYYVQVQRNGIQSRLVDDYRLRINFASECGDGVVGGTEQCDEDSAYCIACDRIERCGDGFVDPPTEACELGEDGCDSSCLWVYTAEIEGNDTIEDARARALEGLTISGDQMLGGTLVASDQIDLFQLDVAEDSVVMLTTFSNEAGSSCSSSGAFIGVSLFDSEGVEQRSYDFASSPCGSIGVNVAAGTHFVAVDQWTSNSIPLYRLHVDFAQPGVLGSEPNGSLETALEVPLTGPMRSIRYTDTTGPSQRAWYSVVVPAGQTLDVETLPGDATQTLCDGVDYNTSVWVYSEQGDLLTSTGSAQYDPSFCANIGSPNPSGLPQRLYIEVGASSSYEGADFDYNVAFRTQYTLP
jgi:hypothetical protein